MPLFTYRALQADGAVAEGQLEAAGRQEVFRQIEARGLRLLNLTEKAAADAGKSLDLPGSLGWLRWGWGGVGGGGFENLTGLLWGLRAGGGPLSRALVILHKEASSPAAAAKWKEIHDLVCDGMSLADAMARSPETFPRVYVAMVQAGETGGFLHLALAQIPGFQSRDKILPSK